MAQMLTYVGVHVIANQVRLQHSTNIACDLLPLPDLVHRVLTSISSPCPVCGLWACGDESRWEWGVPTTPSMRMVSW